MTMSRMPFCVQFVDNSIDTYSCIGKILLNRVAAMSGASNNFNN